MPVQPVPDGYHRITPYLIVKGAAEAIEFYRLAFDATELARLPTPDGRIAHAELQIGDSRIMLGDEVPEMNYLAPQSPGNLGVSFYMYVENVDEVVTQASAAGAKTQRPLQDQFYGDRSATLEDPFGHVWTVATHVEDVSLDEIRHRMEEMSKE